MKKGIMYLVCGIFLILLGGCVLSGLNVNLDNVDTKGGGDTEAVLPTPASPIQ